MRRAEPERDKGGVAVIQSVIVDDELHVRNQMRTIMEATGLYNVLGSYASTTELMDCISSLPPCVVFLDIEMPGMDGLSCAKVIRSRCPDKPVVFVTAHTEFTFAAYGVEAIAYLLKPIHPHDLVRLAERYASLHQVFVNDSHEPEARPVLYLFGKIHLLTEPRQGKRRPVEWRTSKAQELFSCLYLHRHQPLTNERLEDWLWPEINGEKARKLLHTTIYQMKRCLSSAGIHMDLRCRAGMYHVRFDTLDSDVERLEHAFYSLRRMYDRDDALEGVPAAQQNEVSTERRMPVVLTHKELLTLVMDTIPLYRGPLLGQNGCEWAERLCDMYEKAYLDMAYWAAKTLFAEGNVAKGMDTARLALSVVPCEERLHGLILEEYAALGAKGAFIQQYRRMEKTLKEELGILPSTRYQTLRRAFLGV